MPVDRADALLTPMSVEAGNFHRLFRPLPEAIFFETASVFPSNTTCGRSPCPEFPVETRSPRAAHAPIAGVTRRSVWTVGKRIETLCEDLRRERK